MEDRFILSHCHSDAITFATFGIVAINAWLAIGGLLPHLHSFITSALIRGVREYTVVVNTTTKPFAFLRGGPEKSIRTIMKRKQEFITFIRVFFPLN